MKTLDAGADGASARLIKVAQAIELTGQLPKESARTLVRQSRAVRLFLEARENASALDVLRQMHELVGPDQEFLELQELLGRHTDTVRMHTRLNGRTT